MSKPIRVLLTEDNPGDADLIRDTLEASRRDVRVSVVIDGIEALAYLQKMPPFEDSPTPDLILLDLNLPKMGGREVLAEIKSHDSLKQIPVVILTSSDAQHDIVKSYELGAAGHVTKPVGLAAFQNAIRSIEQFWFNAVRLP